MLTSLAENVKKQSIEKTFGPFHGNTLLVLSSL
jgi:hypothetical protein